MIKGWVYKKSEVHKEKEKDQETKKKLKENWEIREWIVIILM